MSRGSGSLPIPTSDRPEKNPEGAHSHGSHFLQGRDDQGEEKQKRPEPQPDELLPFLELNFGL